MVRWRRIGLPPSQLFFSRLRATPGHIGKANVARRLPLVAHNATGNVLGNNAAAKFEFLDIYPPGGKLSRGLLAQRILNGFGLLKDRFVVGELRVFL